MNRLNQPLGDTNYLELGELKKFSANYRFMERTFGLYFWAHNFKDAQEYADAHGMYEVGQSNDVIN